MKERTILIIDDSIANTNLLKTVLQEEYIVDTALSSEEGINKAMLNAPDLILLDVIMPDTDGYITCEKLKKNAQTANIPVVFMTSQDKIDDIVRAFDLGAVDYIIKPFNYIELNTRVKAHIKMKLHKEALLEDTSSIKRNIIDKSLIIKKQLKDLLKDLNEIEQNPKLLKKYSKNMIESCKNSIQLIEKI